MDYHQFFYDSLSIILQAFEDYTPKDYIQILKSQFHHIVTPLKSVYVQIFALQKNKRIKIEQWKFKPKNQTTPQQVYLQRSYSQQNDNDSELSFSELNEPTFFKTLENIRLSIQPKLLLRRLQNPSIICEIKDCEKELVSFENRNTFYFEVSEYENQIFEVKLSFKYNYLEDEVAAQELHELKIIKESESDDFELLIDQSYERQRQRELKQQQTLLLVRQHNELQSQFNLGNQVLIDYRQINALINSYSQNNMVTIIENTIKKSKRQIQMHEMERLYKNIDFSTIESSKFKNFIEYLL